MGTTNRRKFMKTAAAGGVGAGLAMHMASPRRVFGQGPDGFTRIAYRELGSTGFKTSEIGFGAMNMRDRELVQMAVDSGINYIDTAYVYQRGQNEQVVGEVMKSDRDKVFLTTKAMGRDHNDFPGMIDTSLERLNTDHVDLWLYHSVSSPEQVMDGNFMKVFEDARDQGKCRFVGLSTHSNQAAVLDAVVESGFWEAVLVGYNYFTDPSVKASIARARQNGVAIIAMKNLLNPATQPWSELDDIRENPDTSKLSKSQALIKWVLEDDNVDVTIPGITSFEQLREDIELMGMDMTYRDMENVRRYGQALDGNYCRGVAGCTGCDDQCPKGVCVRDINRCLSYANGYRDHALAWERYKELPASSKVDVCSDCDECVVNCVHGIDMTHNIREARRLFG